MDKSIKYWGILIVISGLLYSSCSIKKKQEITFDEHAYIEWFNSFNPKWRKSIQQNDPSYIVSRYDEQAIIGVPNKPFVRGKAAIRAYWQEVTFALDDFAYETQHIGGDPNDILYENGLAFSTYTVNNQQFTDTTKYLFVWKYIGNKEYRILSEMSNALE